MEKLFHSMNPVWEMLFRLHDLLSEVLIRFGKEIKWVILMVAHLSIIVGIMVPSLRRSFGEAAGTLLIILLFLSPLSKIFRMKLLLLLMGFRRELGILMGYFACIHGISYMLRGYDIQNILSFTRWDFATLAPLFGFVAMLFLLPLILTSNRVSTRVFGLWWKRIHFLVYPAFVLIVLHRLFITSGRQDASLLFRGLEAVFLLGSYGILKLLAWKDCSPLLRQVSQSVALLYRSYQEHMKSHEIKNI